MRSGIVLDVAFNREFYLNVRRAIKFERDHLLVLWESEGTRVLFWSQNDTCVGLEREKFLSILQKRLVKVYSPLDISFYATCVIIKQVNTRSLAGKNFIGSKVSSVTNGSKVQMSRWKGMDEDISDDQQDIARGRDMVDSKFQGGFGMGGTHNAVMSSTDYISQGQKNLDNLSVDGNNYYISPSFLDKTAVHVAKNFMDLPKIKVPLILGVWGGKGQGKTFQSNLIFAKLGISPIVMSAGELESGNAGEPAKLVRQRYREASDIVKKGKLSTLFINDLDAGAGRMGGTTQYLSLIHISEPTRPY